MIFKIIYNKEIHLFKVKNPNINELNNFIKNTFRTLPSTYKLSYIDEENDIIAIDTQFDLEVLYDSKLVKVRVLINNSAEGVKCNGCEQIIESIRYQCSKCKSFNFCQQCELANKFHNPTHIFLKIKRDEQQIINNINSVQKSENQRRFMHMTLNDMLPPAFDIQRV